MLSDLPFLTSDECGRAAADVYALRAAWDRRHPIAPFFTLGAASYLDAVAPGSGQLYGVKAARANPILEAHFGWIYERLLAVLERRLEAPVRMAERCARPGFHVFLADRLFERTVASVHVDLQYQDLEWDPDPARAPDLSQPLSFTAPVFIPRAGAGLNTWEVVYDDFKGDGTGGEPERLRMVDLAARSPSSYHAYQLGRLVLHSGHMVHQIAPTPSVTPGAAEDARITLQGHALRCGGTWLVYW